MISKILLSGPYRTPDGESGDVGRAFYQEQIGFGHIEAYTMPLGMGRCAILHFADIEDATVFGAMDMDEPTHPRKADISDPDAATRLIATSILNDPVLFEHITSNL